MSRTDSSASARPVRAIVVDDHDVFRRGFVRLLRDEGIDVVAEASGAQAALKLVSELRPEVVLMDVSMPGVDGLEATRRIVDSGSPTQVVILTIADDDDLIMQALMAGAVGYLQKDASLQSMVAVILAAADGDAVIPPRVGSRVLDRLRALGAPKAEGTAAPQLSERELQVLRLIVDGKDNASIAAELFVSPHTVKNHLANIFAKLGVANRLQASVQALRRGIIS